MTPTIFPTPSALEEGTPTTTPEAVGTIRVEIFLDTNANGLMDFSEEVNDVLVFVTTRDRAWQSEAYTANGEAVIPLLGLPAEAEVIVLVPYLHQGGVVKVKGNTVSSSIDLVVPVYPAYLP